VDIYETENRREFIPAWSFRLINIQVGIFRTPSKEFTWNNFGDNFVWQASEGNRKRRLTGRSS